MIDLNKDISNISSVSTTTLTHLNRLKEKLICHYVLENTSEGDTNLIIDIGIGELHIKTIYGEEVLYKFIPSRYLDDNVVKAITENKSPVISDATKILIDRINSTYKDLF